jgi:hypothetical protein
MGWRRRMLRLSAGEGDDHAVMEICHSNFLIFCSWVNLRSSCSLISSLVKATAPLSVHSPVDHETWRLLASALLDVPCSTLHNGAIDCATAALSDICGLCLNRYASNPAHTHTHTSARRAHCFPPRHRLHLSHPAQLSIRPPGPTLCLAVPPHVSRPLRRSPHSSPLIRSDLRRRRGAPSRAGTKQ